MYSEEMKASSLAKLFAIYDLALVDTSSLMEDSFPAFMDILANSKDYWKDGFKVVLLGDCLDELKKHSQDKKNEPLKAIAALQALKIIKKDQRRKKTFEIRKSLRQDVFADAAIMSVATAEHIHNKVLVITQDKNLTKDLLNLNNLESQRGRWLKVYRLDVNGMLIESDGNPSYTSRKNLSPERNRTPTRPTKPQKNEGERKPNPLLVEIVKKDQYLAENLGKGNYSDEKKKNDIEKQISLLSKLSNGEKDKLKLSLPEDKLKEALNKYNNSIAAKNSQQKAKSSEKQKPNKKPSDSQKPAENAVKEKEDKNAPFYYFGQSFSKAFIKLFMSKGWILRDASVPYFSAIHGPYDITLADLEKVDKLGEEAKAEPLEAELNGLSLLLKKEDGSCYCAIAPKKEEPSPERKKETPKKPQSKKTQVEKADKEKPVVEETPSPTKEKGKPRSSKPKEAEPEKAEPKETPEPKPEKATKKKTPKPTEEPPAPKSEKPAPEVQKTSSPPPAKTKSAKKVPAKAKAIDPQLIEDIKKADMKLNANINNPNFPVQRAIEDINSQLLRLQSLSQEGKKDLLLSQSELEKRAKELKKKISKNKES